MQKDKSRGPGEGKEKCERKVPPGLEEKTDVRIKAGNCLFQGRLQMGTGSQGPKEEQPEKVMSTKIKGKTNERQVMFRRLEGERTRNAISSWKGSGFGSIL